jgi:hypothetical protein
MQAQNNGPVLALLLSSCRAHKKAGSDKSEACKKDRASNKVRRVNRVATIDKVGAIKDRTDYSREKT